MPEPSETDLQQAHFLLSLTQHLSSRRLRETAEDQENKYKKLVLDQLTEIGDETPEGHFVFDMTAIPENDQPGWPGDRRVTSVKREKRVTTKLDPDVVDKLLAPDLRDQVFRKNIFIEGLSASAATAVLDALSDLGVAAEAEDMIDEDELLGLNYESVVSDDDLRQMYVEGKVVYALKVNYAKS